MPHQLVESSSRRVAKVMRKRMTPAEFKLWQSLSNRKLEGLRFRRQAPLGPYIADFFCPEKKLVVELDGGQHARHHAQRLDAERDEWMRGHGHVVLRFHNQTVMKEMDRVYDAILAASRSRESAET
jgi:very-short-patch-repair endonuclease